VRVRRNEMRSELGNDMDTPEMNGPGSSDPCLAPCR
jgi:hypothetical protein